MSAQILDLRIAFSVAIRSAAISASILDLLSALSATYLSASISAAILDLRSALSATTSASILDLLSAVSVQMMSASILDLLSDDSATALEAAISAASLDLLSTPSASTALARLSYLQYRGQYGQQQDMNNYTVNKKMARFISFIAHYKLPIKWREKENTRQSSDWVGQHSIVSCYDYDWLADENRQKEGLFQNMIDIININWSLHSNKYCMEELPRKKLNIVVISDTHRSYRQLEKIAEMNGDIFIHAGDFTRYGCDKDFLKFFQYLDRLKFRYKVVIAGNHEIVLDNGCIKPAKRAKYLEKYPCKLAREQVIAELRKRCIYLQHQFVQIEGIRIFGSPYSPYYVGNAFQYNQKDEKIIWDCIPEKVDLLVTHCPPLGILDETTGGKHGGSAYLREVVAKRRPKYHVFGHIHEAAGMFKTDGVTFLNVANDPTRIML